MHMHTCREWMTHAHATCTRAVSGWAFPPPNLKILLMKMQRALDPSELLLDITVIQHVLYVLGLILITT